MIPPCHAGRGRGTAPFQVEYRDVLSSFKFMLILSPEDPRHSGKFKLSSCYSVLDSLLFSPVNSKSKFSLQQRLREFLPSYRVQPCVGWATTFPLSHYHDPQTPGS